MEYNLISESLRVSLCEQLAHEKMNSNIYLMLAGFLKNKGLDNLAKIFEEQHVEEFEHSKLFYDLLTDLNAKVDIPEIDECICECQTVHDVASLYMERELLTTTSLNEIKKQAIDEENPVVEEFIREMIEKQQKEYSEATSFMDNAMMMPEWWQVALWNNSIGK